ncbi:MAG: DNA primase [Luminiphilus sp.]|nr:DNA primase [Halieaceae bacterium]RPG88855.1 MAG: DNA primase [Cellvibrionales bacterium TMED157]|tara:strand:+ start:9796 stop:11661 length:1866 start_codon:yes stop_codon:yes gene_type:complete
MARLPQAFIDQVLDRTDIVDVVDRRVKLKKAGKNYSACCPFHQEKTPSFSVNPEKQFYYCFGCGAGGNALGFIMDYERMEFREAIESLAQAAGIELPPEEADAAPQVDHQKPLYEAMEKATRVYESQLRKHPSRGRVVDYLKQRGLSGEIARDFRLGFAPEGWDNLMTTLSSEEEIGQALTAGLLIQNDSGRKYDRFRDRVIFPIVNQRGKVIAMGGRVLGDGKPKYLNSPETPLFSKSHELYGLHHIRKFAKNLSRIVVVEGYMDVIALAQFGIHYAVATLGTSVGKPHLEMLFRRVDHVVFCFDGDEAGRKAAFRGMEAALPMMEDGRQVKFLFLPEGEDPDSVVRNKGSQHLEHLFDNADPLETFLFDQMAQGIDLNTMDGKARLSKLVAPYINLIPDGVFKTLLFKALADRTDMDVDSLRRLREIEKSVSAEYESTPAADPSEGLSESDAPFDYPDGYEAMGGNAHLQGTPLQIEPNRSALSRALGLIVLKPSAASAITDDLLPDQGGTLINLLHEVVRQVRETPELSTAALLGYWMGTDEGELLSEAAAKEVIDDEQHISEHLMAILNKLSRDRHITLLRKRAETLKSVAYTDLSNEQKRELVSLTTEIRKFSGRN